MSEIYAMRRANGDWFALDAGNRFRVPLFESSRDALMARLRHSAMLVFEPVALDAHLLKEILELGAGGNVDYCVVKDPFANLKRGSLTRPAELLLLLNDSSAATQTSESEGGTAQTAREAIGRSPVPVIEPRIATVNV